MTVIVAVSDGVRVCMGCDSRVTEQGTGLVDVLASSACKIVRSGAVLFGVGDGVLIQTLRHHHDLPPPDNPAQLHEWATLDFVPWIWEKTRARGKLENEKGLESLPGRILVACGPNVVELDYYGFLVEHAGPFCAIGSGRSLALGAMWAIRESSPALAGSPGAAQTMAYGGVRAACAFDNGCGPPVRIEWTSEWPAAVE